MFVINLIPGCKFRATMEAEIVGMDVSAVDLILATMLLRVLVLDSELDLDLGLGLDLDLDLGWTWTWTWTWVGLGLGLTLCPL
jgi:hypothetical protein